MEQNKTGKYFKYAIGEIVLVVIGILIALSINNWNQKRIENIDRNELVNSLTMEFKNVIVGMEETLKIREYLIKDVTNVINVLYNENNNIPIDSIKQLTRSAFLGDDFQPQTPIYNMALSSGKIGLINDNVFFIKISEFMVAKEMYTKMTDLGLNMAFIGPLWKIKEEQWEVYKPMEDIPKRFLLTDEEYINYVSQAEVIAKFKNKRSLNENIARRLKRMIEVSKEIVDNFESKK